MSTISFKSIYQDADSYSFYYPSLYISAITNIWEKYKNNYREDLEVMRKEVIDTILKEYSDIFLYKVFNLDIRRDSRLLNDLSYKADYCYRSNILPLTKKENYRIHRLSA